MSKKAILTISPPDYAFADAHVRPDKCASAGCYHTKLDESNFCAACVARGLAVKKLVLTTCDNLPPCQDPTCSNPGCRDLKLDGEDFCSACLAEQEKKS